MRRARHDVVRFGLGLALTACAGLLERPREEVAVAVDDLDVGSVAPDLAVVRDEGSGVGPDAAQIGDASADAGVATPGGPTIYLRVRADAFADGLRVALEPPHAASADGALESLGARVVPVMDVGAPGGPERLRLRARLAARFPATAMYLPGARSASIGTDVLHLAAAVLDDPSVARWEGRPLVFVERPASEAVLRDALEYLAALPRRPAVLLSAGVLAPEAASAGLSAEASAVIVGHFASEAEGYAASGSGELPDAAESRALDAGRQSLRGRGVLLPLARAARNPRRNDPSGPVEAPLADTGLLRSLVLASRDARTHSVQGRAGALLVDGLGGWRDDRQLDALDDAAPETDAPSSLTDRNVYPNYGSRRLRLLAETLLDPERAVSSGAALAPAPSLAELARSDRVTVLRLETAPEPGGEAVIVSLEDRSGGGRWEVLLDHRPFFVPAAATLRYERSTPALRVEFALDDDGGDQPRDRLLALETTAPAAESVEVDLSSLEGRRVSSVVLVYGGGAGAVDGRISAPRLEFEARAED